MTVEPSMLFFIHSLDPCQIVRGESLRHRCVGVNLVVGDDPHQHGRYGHVQGAAGREGQPDAQGEISLGLFHLKTKQK